MTAEWVNNKKALAKTFWNIWEWWWVRVGGIVGDWILGIGGGALGCVVLGWVGLGWVE